MTHRLIVTPERPRLDTELHIRLDGLPSGGEVTLRADTHHRYGSEWRSSVTFRVAADGTVDLARDTPLHGSYRGVEPMGLVWSAEPVGSASSACRDQPGRPDRFAAGDPRDAGGELDLPGTRAAVPAERRDARAAGGGGRSR